MTRRALALTGVSMSIAFASGHAFPARSQETITVDQFRNLSARLTGAAVPDLDAGVAEKILEGLLAIGRAPGLKLLANDPTIFTGTVAEDIIASWYSGIYETGQGEILATFNDALVWTALDYTKPFGSCGGETGYWAEPPQSQP
jgi:hypothetical protein